jgi:L-serine deaminase
MEKVAQLIERPQPDDMAILSYDVDECQRLVGAAAAGAMLVPVAIGSFCGVRRAEMCRRSASKQDHKAIGLEASPVTAPRNAAEVHDGAHRLVDPTHAIEPDVPRQNIVAPVKAV